MYVLITAARNEADYIERTIQSVLSQTMLPRQWIIVSDGSTDQTDELIEKYAKDADFIRFIRRPNRDKRDFSSKVFALNTAIGLLPESGYEFVGILDADIGVNNDYYANIIERFKGNPYLGLAGGTRYDLIGDRFYRVRCASNSVGGPIQLFRRECFKQIGAFVPIPYGGEDAVAEISARMYGWKVRSFADIKAYHYRATGTADKNLFRSAVNDGIRLYVIGYHPLFFFFKCLYRAIDRPILINSLLLFSGYFYAWKKNLPRPISEALRTYLQKEQMQFLKFKLFKTAAH